MLKSIFPFNPFNKNKASKEAAQNFLGGGGGSTSFFRAGRRNQGVRSQTKNIDPVIENVSGSNSRFGRASGLDFINFFGNKKVTKKLSKSITRLKDALLQTFTVSKALRASTKNIFEQLKGLGGGTAGKFTIGGLILGLGLLIGKLFGKQIKAALEWIETTGQQILDWIRSAAGTFEKIYNFIDKLANKFGIDLPDIQLPGFLQTQEEVEDDLPESSLDKALEQAATAPVTPTPGVGRPVTSGSGISGNFLPSNPPLKSQTKVKPQTSLMGGASPSSGLANLIASKESGDDYTKIVGGSVDSSILNKTITELAAQRGGQTAMGRYQIQMNSAQDVLRGAGKDPSTFKFDQAGQDEIYKLLLKRRGLDDYLAGEITKEQFALRLSQEWAALPVPFDTRGAFRRVKKGQSYYAGDGVNQSLIDVNSFLKQIESLKAPKVKPVVNQQQSNVPQKKSNLISLAAPQSPVAQPQPRPQQTFNMNGSSSSGSGIAFLSPSNPDSLGFVGSVYGAFA